MNDLICFLEINQLVDLMCANKRCDQAVEIRKPTMKAVWTIKRDEKRSKITIAPTDNIQNITQNSFLNIF